MSNMERPHPHQRSPLEDVAVRPLVIRGIEEPLGDVEFHTEGPLKRWLLSSSKLDAVATAYAAAHRFAAVVPGERGYAGPHVHPFVELNFLVSEDGSLEMDVQLGSEVQRLRAPATIVIPAGVTHSANVYSGSGFLIAVILSPEYVAHSAG